MTSLLKRQNN